MARNAKARLLLLPCIIYLLLSAAYFYHNQLWVFAVVCCISLAAALIRQPWCLRINQLSMLILAGEWIYLLKQGQALQSHLPQSWANLAIVTLSIISLHVIGALIFQHTSLRRYFGFPRTFLFR